MQLFKFSLLHNGFIQNNSHEYLLICMTLIQLETQRQFNLAFNV